MELAGRQAWLLSDLALVYQARGNVSSALRLLREGWQPTIAGSEADKHTCRGNAALLLWRRREPGDLATAQILLETVVAGDPGRIRTRYWLARLIAGTRR